MPKSTDESLNDLEARIAASMEENMPKRITWPAAAKLVEQTPAPAVLGPAKRNRAAERVRRAEKLAGLALQYGAESDAAIVDGIIERMGTDEAKAARAAKRRQAGEHSGGAVDYYRLHIEHPTMPKRKPYTVECNDVIEALELNYAEGNVLKAIWRTAAKRKGKMKRNHDTVYDAEKIIFFGHRILARAKRTLS